MDPEAYMDSLPQPSNDPSYPIVPLRPPTPEPETTTTTEKPYIYADTMSKIKIKANRPSQAHIYPMFQSVVFGNLMAAFPSK